MPAKPYKDAEDEERQRISKALQNVEDWKTRWADAGFSGAVRVVAEDVYGRVLPVHEIKIGDEKTAEAVISQTQMAQPPDVHPVPTRVPRHPWLRWLFDLISTEK